MSNGTPVKLGFASFFSGAPATTTLEHPPKSPSRPIALPKAPSRPKQEKSRLEKRNYKCIADADLDKTHKGKPILRYGTVSIALNFHLH